MLINEFIERTGFTPTDDCYHKFIEPDYDHSNLDKDEWCKQWKRQGGIAKAYQWQVQYFQEWIGDLNAAFNLKTKQNAQLQESNKELAAQNESLMNECNLLNICKEKADAYDEEQRQLAEWLIAMSQKWGADDLRARAIHIMGDKQYIAYKLENDIPLWEADKNLIINTLCK